VTAKTNPFATSLTSPDAIQTNDADRWSGRRASSALGDFDQMVA
jgi:hypothetical protein